MTNEPAPPPVSSLVDHLFRKRAGQMVATLARIFGGAHLHLAEDVVQEALVKALRVWSFHGIPSQPEAWLFKTARNLALDVLRRDASFRDKQDEIVEAFERASRAATGRSVPGYEDELRDDQLRLVFTCCHPSLSREAQVALTLKALCGFGVEEIARAFLTPVSTIAQRIVRAKHRLREVSVSFETPAPDEIAKRRDVVMDVVYLMFNEAHVAHRGAALVRVDMLRESLRLARLLAAHPRTDGPRVRALLALMLLTAARFDARTDEQGDMVLLKHQDRRLWDSTMIRAGLDMLDASSEGQELTDLHLQAAIAACHSTAASWGGTDWAMILQQYDLLMSVAPSPIVALNRTVALAEEHGPEVALEALEELHDVHALQNYYLLPALRGEMFLRLDRKGEAASELRRALSLPCSDPERRFLVAKLARCEDG